MGFSSVMIDGSSLPFAENIKLTKKVVAYAHKYDVTVEAELGVLAGVEDEVAAEESHYTKPEEVIEFATKTGCDSLAISIGTSHGAYKFKPEQCTRDPKTGLLIPPPLAFDVLKAIEKKLPGFPIVLHGSSSVPQEYVKIINENGGKLPDAVGIPEAQLRKAAKSAVCKINIDSDSRPQGGEERGVQDQHRLRLPSRYDRGRAPVLRAESRPLRPAPVPRSGARGDEETLHPQDREGSRLEQQALSLVITQK